MATEALKSTPVTNAEASPVVFNNSGVEGGAMRQSVATVEATAKDAGSTYRMLRIPSNATGISLIFACDDLGTTATVNVGLHQTTANGGAVVDADFFASAVDCNSAAVAPTHIEHESGVYGIEDIETPLWEALGLSADPGIDYDVMVTSVGAIDQAGTISLKAQWAI
jgi:hypothetical protein